MLVFSDAASPPLSVLLPTSSVLRGVVRCLGLSLHLEPTFFVEEHFRGQAWIVRSEHRRVPVDDLVLSG